MTLQHVNFKVNTPDTEDSRGRNIASALLRDLKPVDAKTVLAATIIANGPSARHAPLADLRGSLDTLVAVNGALSLFLRQGLRPDIWALADSQPACADFLPDDPPHNIQYWIASKCDPTVFDKLTGRDVRLWHVDDHPMVKDLRPVKCASSVTLVLLRQLRAIGYRHFEVYGWDGCYIDGLHHASEGSRSPLDSDLELIVGAEMIDNQPVPNTGRAFKTNRTWALEAQDAVIQLHHADYTVNIHGDGLIRAMVNRLV